MGAITEKNVAECLERAWQQLVGSKLEFKPHALSYAEHAGDLHAVIPVEIPSAHETSGIALRISKKIATELAANLFGIDPASVDDSQRIDVCAELSNILCSSVTPLFADQDDIELGVPRNVNYKEFQNILARNEVGSLYEAEPGEGNVTVVIVNSFKPKAEAAAPSDTPLSAVGSNSVSAAQVGEVMKFLIVDDSRAIQTIVRRAVEKAGLPNLEVQAASNGDEALKIAKDWQPQFMITDWHMPGMSGLELLTRLKAEQATIKVGFVTTEASQKKLDEARASGAEFVLRKPFADEELIAAVLKMAGNSASAADAAPSDAAAAVRRVDLDTLSRFFSASLKQAIKLVEAPPCSLDEVQAPWVIGLYSLAGANDVRGFCLFDWSSVVFVGSTLAGVSGKAITGSIHDPATVQKLYEQVAKLLSDGAETLFSGMPGQRIVLAKSQLVQEPPEKLKEIMQKSRGRTDFIIEQAGLPLGRITVIAR